MKLLYNWCGGVQDDAADVVTKVARKFLTAMSLNPETSSGRDALWQKIETVVDHRSEHDKKSEDTDMPHSTSALWASAEGVQNHVYV